MAVTKKGLVAAFCVALASQVLAGTLLWTILAPTAGEATSWRLDLIFSASAMATMPLYLLAARAEAPSS